LRVVFMGTPEYAVSALERLFFEGYQVVAVYTRPDRAAGRGRALVSSPVKLAAEGMGLPVVQPDSFKDNSTVVQLSGYKPDVIVVYAYSLFLPQRVLDIPEYGCVNIHPSLLPRYRGTAPAVGAILSGDDFTGVTIMKMAAGLDTGPVLARAQVQISAEDTTGSLNSRLSLITSRLILDVLPRWVKGEITPVPQDEDRASYIPALSKKDGEIDWDLPAADIWRRVRAFSPWPGCYTEWRGKQLKIMKAVSLPAENKPEPGRVTVLSGGEAAFGIGTGYGILGVLEVQLEGKRAMTAADFLRGQRRFIGELLPSGS